MQETGKYPERNFIFWGGPYLWRHSKNWLLSFWQASWLWQSWLAAATATRPLSTRVTAEYNTAEVAKAEKVAQLWDSYAAEIKSIEKKQSEHKYDTTADYQKARADALHKVFDAATLDGEYYGFVTVQEKDADTIQSIVTVLKKEGATKYGYSNSRTKAAFESKNVPGTFAEGEFIVLVYEK